MLWTSTLFMGLGDLELSTYWLDRVEAVAPNNSFYLQRRADNYAAQLKPEQFSEHVDNWLAREPNNLFAKRYGSYASAQRAEVAFDREDIQSFRELTADAISEGMEYLALTGGDGKLVVRLFNSWSFLFTAVYAASIGEDELARQLFQQVLDYYLNDLEGGNTSRHLHQATALAGLGDTESALDHIRAMRAEGFRALWLVHTLELTGDKFGIYHGLSSNIAFMDEIKKMEALNTATLDHLRDNAPSIFPSELTPNGKDNGKEF